MKRYSVFHANAITHVFSNRVLFVGLFLAIIFLTGTYAESQDPRTSLTRPEWQLRAELEFKLRLQQANRELCGALFEELETAELARATTTRQSLRQILPSLLHLVDDQPPESLPDLPASVVYLDARQAAFLNYTKTMAEHSRQPSDTIVKRESNLQKEIRATFRSAIVAKGPVTEPTSVVATPIVTSSKASVAAAASDTLAHQPTVKNIAVCLRRLMAFDQFNPQGDTTVEKSRSLELERRKLAEFFQKPKEWVLHYPVRDVSGSSNSSTMSLQVGPPIEFVQAQTENPDLKEWKSAKDSWSTKSASIAKSWVSIKPNDFLRVTVQINMDGDELFAFDDRIDRQTSQVSQNRLRETGIGYTSSKSLSLVFEIVKKRDPKPAAEVGKR